nr:MAG TPA: hypothetical protein [Caudoviricetes sp.]
MKVIIHRDKQTKKIVDEFDEYGRLEKAGKTEAEIASLIMEYNKREDYTQTAEIVELDELAEFYRQRKLNAYKDQINDFAVMEDKLEELASEIRDYIDEAKKVYEEDEK